MNREQSAFVFVLINAFIYLCFVHHFFHCYVFLAGEFIYLVFMNLIIQYISGSQPWPCRVLYTAYISVCPALSR